MGTQPEDNSEALPAGIAVGDRIGRFEILGSLGAGGMGDVYRARDPQLSREVAVKVLLTAFWRDPARQHRLEREARAAASLNHPNVLAVHDFGLHDGIAFLVTELLEGETLRKRIDGRPLPPAVAVGYAVQIASGLAAGHDRGIVHRDIKPDNLFVTTEGRIKILDFGLAMIDQPASSPGASRTVTLEEVPPVSVAGTVAYMSPEQARGLRTDQRSDIFSLGVVIYEMLAGFAPFRRNAASETINAVLHEDPSALSGVSPELERLVLHCLGKVPEERFQNARDLIFALQELPPSALKKRSPLRRVSRAGARTLLALLGLMVAAGIGYFSGQELSPPRSSPTNVHRVHRLTDLAGLEEFSSISPDGRSVAFTASLNGRRQIFVRLVAGGRPVQITNDDVDHQVPRWSPDGNSLLYFSPGAATEYQGKIWSIPALGGSPRLVINSVGGADVNREGRVTCFRVMNGAVQLVTSEFDGSGIEVIARSVPGFHLSPRWSPDGKWIAFQRGDGVRYDIFIIGSDGGNARQLTKDKHMVSGLAWTPDSLGVVYGSSRGSTLPYLPPLALWHTRIDGSASRQITPAEAWYEQPDVHDNGLVSATRMRMRFDIWSFPFEPSEAKPVGAATQVTRQTGQVLTPTASPDGDHIAFLSDSGGHGNLWVMSTSSGELRQITFENDSAVTIGVPVWSPDGKSIAFVSSKGLVGYQFGVWLVDADGGNLRNVARQGLGMAWSPDAQWLYYAEVAAGVLNKVPASGGASVKVRTEARNVIGFDGTTLYYTVSRVLLDGRPEFEIRAATPDNGPSRALARIPASRVPRWQIVNPSLSPDGEWLAMPLTDGFTTNIWVLSTRTGAWRQVTDLGERATFIARRVSWSADGRSILASVGEGDSDVVLLDGLIAARKP